MKSRKGLAGALGLQVLDVIRLWPKKDKRFVLSKCFSTTLASACFCYRVGELALVAF
jgi:hypothetical protein